MLSQITQEEFLRMHATNQGLRCRIYRLPGIYDARSLSLDFSGTLPIAFAARVTSSTIHLKTDRSRPFCSAIDIARVLQAALIMPPEAQVHLSAASSSCLIREIAKALAPHTEFSPSYARQAKGIHRSFSTSTSIFWFISQWKPIPKGVNYQLPDGLVQCL